MKKAVPIVIVLLVVVVAIGWFVTRSSSSDKSSSTDSSSQAGTAAKPVATNTVTVDNMAFSPAAITVKKGTTVTWTNKDSVAHTVTQADDQTGPSSGELATGKSYSFKYDMVGTYKYFCTIHRTMTGTVTVTE